MRASNLSRSGLDLTQGTNLIRKQIQCHKVMSQSRALTLNCFNFKSAEKQFKIREEKWKGRGGYGIKRKLLPRIHIALKHKQ